MIKRLFLFDMTFNNLGRFQGTVIAPTEEYAIDIIGAQLLEDYNETVAVQHSNLNQIATLTDVHNQINFF